jgi:hypothetical protein
MTPEDDFRIESHSITFDVKYPRNPHELSQSITRIIPAIFDLHEIPMVFEWFFETSTGRPVATPPSRWAASVRWEDLPGTERFGVSAGGLFQAEE